MADWNAVVGEESDEVVGRHGNEKGDKLVEGLIITKQWFQHAKQSNHES